MPGAPSSKHFVDFGRILDRVCKAAKVTREQIVSWTGAHEITVDRWFKGELQISGQYLVVLMKKVPGLADALIKACKI